MKDIITPWAGGQLFSTAQATTKRGAYAHFHAETWLIDHQEGEEDLVEEESLPIQGLAG